jgi:Asp-tRNA(Asn)/Glu-tRNA(Gln) amidotransferase A subunit family amidase
VTVLADLAAAVRAGTRSARDLVALSFDRIERHNPTLNAVVARRDRDEALAEAAALDATIADAGSTEVSLPLAGLPLLVKDTDDAAGLPTTYGSLLHEGAAPAAADSQVVARLRAAGAIVVGKSNVPEFAFEGFTNNRLFGATPNPWAMDWSPGGSSGGAGSALITGMVALATATDGGGSVRIPAAFCGLAGLKPTQGLIGRDPIPSWMDMSTHGPLAVSIANVALLLEVMRGPAAGDPSSRATWSPRDGAWPSRVLAAPRFVDTGPLPDGIAASFETAVAAFGSATGLAVEAIPAPWVGERHPTIDEDWIVMAAVEEMTMLGREVALAEMDRFAPYFATMMRIAMKVTADGYADAKRRRFGYTRDLDLLLGEDVVLLTPTMCVEGFWADGRMVGGDDEATDAAVYNTAATNITGHPSLSVPAGLSANGVPFGLQITGPRWADDLVLALGAAYEAANPWPLAAPGYEPFGM